MSTWISKAPRFALFLWLGACQAITGSSKQPQAVSVLGGAVQVAAPTGYCVDPQSARQQADGAVVLIGRCNQGSAQPAAVIGVAIGAAASAGAIADGGTALAAFFATPAGRAALSRSGQASSILNVQTNTADGVYSLRVQEAGTGPYWRAVLGLSGRLVTISVQSAAGAALDTAAGQKLLAATVISMRRANPPRKN